MGAWALSVRQPPGPSVPRAASRSASGLMAACTPVALCVCQRRTYAGRAWPRSGAMHRFCTKSAAAGHRTRLHVRTAWNAKVVSGAPACPWRLRETWLFPIVRIAGVRESFSEVAIVGMCDDKVREEHAEAGTAPTQKRPYHRPELTKHELLSEITLGLQCSLTVPSCISPQDPFA